MSFIITHLTPRYHPKAVYYVFKLHNAHFFVADLFCGNVNSREREDKSSIGAR